mmetsp:Transcript_61490/g.159650  ORF Transcript_61490/g.159650 Transcript_61490/m.159650 type:complete len:1373 (+) Transcript_61490:69-4187(+)
MQMPASAWLLLWVGAAVAVDLLRTANATSVLVLGAGAAGMAASRRLLEAGITDITVLEASSTIGGRMRSADLSGRTVELGANWISGHNGSNWLTRLAQEHGVSCSDSDWESWSDYDEHGPIPGRLRWADFTAWKGKFRALARRYSDEELPDVSVLAGTRLMGWHPRDKYDEALMVQGFHWEDAAMASAVSLKYQYPIATYHDFGERECMVNDPRGFSEVLRGMATAFNLSSKIRFNQTVRSISYDSSIVSVATQDASYHADHVIVTFSVGVLQNELVDFRPALPEWKSQAIQKYGMGLFAKVFFEFPSKFWPDDLVHFYVDAMRGYYPLWLNMNVEGQLGPGPPYVLMLTVMSVNAAKLESQAENVTVAEAMTVLQSMFPKATVPRPTRVLFHRWGEDSLYRGSYSYWPVGVTLADKEQMCAPVGPVWFAGEACSVDYAGFVHGALLSGNDTASSMVRCINDASQCPSPPSRGAVGRSLTPSSNGSGGSSSSSSTGAAASSSIPAVRQCVEVVAFALAVLAGALLFREGLILCGVFSARGTSRRWILQLAVACNSVLESLEYSFLIPVSYSIAIAAGEGPAMSGFLVGVNGIGNFLGSCAARATWRVLSPGPALHSLIVLCPLFNAAVYLGLSLQLASGGVIQFEILLGLRAAAGFFEGLAQLLQYLVRAATPPEEMIRLGLLEYAGCALGAGVGPILCAAVLSVAAGGREVQLAPADLFAAPAVVVASMCALSGALWSLVVPTSLADAAGKDGEEVEEDVDAAGAGPHRRSVVMLLCTLLAFLATGVACAVEVATALILQVEGGWGQQAIGFAVGGVICAAAVVGCVLLSLRELGFVEDSHTLWGMLGVTAVGIFLLMHDFEHEPRQILVADLLMYPCIVCVAAIAEGAAFEAAAPSGSLFSVPNLIFASTFADALAKAVSTPLARHLIHLGGREAYASVLLAVLVAMAAACGLVVRLMPSLFSQSLELSKDSAQASRHMEVKTEKLSDASTSNSAAELSDALALTSRNFGVAGEEGHSDYLMVLSCEVPDNVAPGDCEYGRGLFATRDMSAGEVIFKAKFHLVDDKPGKILLKTNLQDFELEVQTHFPYIGEGRREVNYYDCFTNHSCEPNMFYPAADIHFDIDGKNGEYVACASRDIRAGDELTCDYELFDWDCLDKGMVNCMCKAAACRGAIRGMRYRPFDEVLTQLAAVEPIMRKSVLRQYPNIQYIDMTPCAPGLSIVFTRGLGLSLVSTRDFAPGQILYEGESCSVDCDRTEFVACGFFPGEPGVRIPPRTATFSIDQVRLASLEDERHPGCREFFGFGLLLEPSAQSKGNAEILRTRDTGDVGVISLYKYQVRSREAIAVGEVVSCAVQKQVAMPACSSRLCSL